MMWYQWPEHKMLVSYQLHGASTTYGVMCDGATMAQFLEHVLRHHDRQVASITTELLGEEEWDLLEEYYGARGLILVGD